MDTDNSGTITLEELKQGLAKQGTKLSDYEIKQLMEAVSFILLNFNDYWRYIYIYNWLELSFLWVKKKYMYIFNNDFFFNFFKPKLFTMT